MATEKVIEFRDVRLGYGKKVVLSDLTFSLDRGDFLGIVGPNGSGKTTILKAILGIIKPQSGVIQLWGKDSRKIIFGYVPQQGEVDPLFPFSVLDVVLMGRLREAGPGKRFKRVDREIALQCLDHVGIADLARHPFQELSGGQKQRALIARALTARPHVLILDEPTAGMDLVSEKNLMELIEALHREESRTVVIVGHNLNLIANYATKIAIIDKGNFMVGDRLEVLTDANLSNLYGIIVTVKEIQGRRVIMVGGEP